MLLYLILLCLHSSGGLDSHTTLNGSDDLEVEKMMTLLKMGLDEEVFPMYKMRKANFMKRVLITAVIAMFVADAADTNDVYSPFDSSLLQSSSSESHSSGLSGSSIVSGVSESTKVPIAQSNGKSDS